MTAPNPSTAALDASQSSSHEIVIAVSALEDLFNAPDTNPFVDTDLRALGQPALDRAVRDVQMDGLLDRRPVRVIVQRPTAQVSAEPSRTEIANAVHRYYEAKHADNAQQIRLTRHNAAPLLIIAIIFVILVGLLIYVLFGAYLTHAGDLGRLVVLGSYSVFAWVILWDTLEAYLIDPIQAMWENRALRRLLTAEVIVDITAAT